MHELSSARFQSASRVKMRDGVSFRERGKFHDVVRTFQKRRKNYMKPVQTGLNRFIPVLYPDTSRKACHNRQYWRSLTFDLSLGLITLQGPY